MSIAPASAISVTQSRFERDLQVLAALDLATTRACLAYELARKDLPGPEWECVTGVLLDEWIQLEFARAVIECGMREVHVSALEVGIA